MNKYDIANIFENFAHLELQEKWDCSGWIVETQKDDIKRVMVALTVTDNVFNQAVKRNCDMIISHHPLFKVPTAYKNIDIYCAHTNMDKALGGTTDTLSKALGFNAYPDGEFLRIVETRINIKDLAQKIKKISPYARLINNIEQKEVSKIALCAGSGMDMYSEAVEKGCDCFITGDIKYHNAVDAKIVMFDIGHFESEILIKKVFKNMLENKIEVIFADEESPFKNI